MSRNLSDFYRNEDDVDEIERLKEDLGVLLDDNKAIENQLFDRNAELYNAQDQIVQLQAQIDDLEYNNKCLNDDLVDLQEFLEFQGIWLDSM